MSIQELERASGRRIMKGLEGKVYPPPGLTTSGSIIFQKAPVVGIDQNLYGVLKAAADTLSLCLSVSSIDTGIHIPTSRHYQGRAADVDLIGPSAEKLTEVRVGEPSSEKLAHWLFSSGFHYGEGGPWPAILFGDPHTLRNPSAIPHAHHIHVSIGPLPGDEEGGAEAEEEPA